MKTQTKPPKASKQSRKAIESEQNLVYELMVRLIPDDVATPEDLKAIAMAEQELADGDVVDFDDVDWK